jgi:hypothetical protein
VAERVRGILFVDYVRMVRSKKDVDWAKHLTAADEAILAGRIDPHAWYPMATFERLGLGIMSEIARGALDGVRMWGRFQVDAVRTYFPELLAEGDPRETLMRFDVLAGSFFDSGALRVLRVDDDSALVGVSYGMSPVAEESASHQTLGFFERLVDLAGGKAVDARFQSTSWDGGDATRIALHWDPPHTSTPPPRRNAKTSDRR